MFEAFENHKNEEHEARAEQTLGIEDKKPDRRDSKVTAEKTFKGPHLGDLIKELLDDKYSAVKEEEVKDRACFDEETFEKAADFFEAVRDSDM